MKIAVFSPGVLRALYRAVKGLSSINLLNFFSSIYLYTYHLCGFLLSVAFYILSEYPDQAQLQGFRVIKQFGSRSGPTKHRA